MADTQQIAPDAKFGQRIIKTVSSFQRLHIIFMAVSGVAFLLAFIFLILYAVKASSGNDPPSICIRPPCMETAAHYVQLINTSQNPCDDFHAYTCGAWPTWNPIHPPNTENTVNMNILRKNYAKLEQILERPAAESASTTEKKLKTLIKTCLQDYGRMTKTDNPFKTTVLDKIKPLYLFDEDSLATWDTNWALKQVTVDLWTEALFTLRVDIDRKTKTDTNTYIVLDRGGLGMDYKFYHEDYTDTYQNAYKTYIGDIARLLVRDSGVTMDENTVNSRVRVFVEDVFNFERGLAGITKQAHPNPDPFDDEARMTLGELNAKSSNAIDWIGLLSHLFNKASISDNTPVILMRKDYIQSMTKHVDGLPNKNRVLNNYFVWRLTSEYMQDLSWEYIHVDREFNGALTGRAEFLGSWRYCLDYASRRLGLAVSHLFIKDHFADKNKEKIHEITDYLKKAALNNIGWMDWMDAGTKAKATDKVNTMLGLYGYPEYLIDSAKVDKIYESLVLDDKDYFTNIHNVNKFEQDDLNNLLSDGFERTKFRGTTYYGSIAYTNMWNEIIVPAGFLQPPLYDYKYPYYVNFGSIGSEISHQFIHAIDILGSYYTADGKYERWWTDSTMKNYESKSKCIDEFYSGKSIGPFEYYGRQLTFPIKAKEHNAERIAKIAGIRYAYEAYKQWQMDNGYEEHLPGIDLTNEQLFFVAYAQTKCFAMTDATKFNQALKGMIPQDIETNSALSQMDEFAKAFNCPADSKMVAAKKCKIY